MLVCRHPTASTRNVQVKSFSWCSFLKESFFSHKYITLAMFTFLLRVEREIQFPWENPFFFVAACSELHREEPSSQDKLSLQKQCGLRSDLRKAVNRRVPKISTYCSIFNSTVWSFRPWDVFLLILKIIIFIFMGHVR